MLTRGYVVYYARIVGESIDLGCVTFAPQPLLSGLHSFWGTQFLHMSVNYPARARRLQPVCCRLGTPWLPSVEG